VQSLSNQESEVAVSYRPSPAEARAALDTVEQHRRSVVAEIAVPRWYWWGTAAGWVALGLVTDTAPAWVASAATLLFGAVHATAASRVADGRHGSGRLEVRADVAGRHVVALVIGFVVLLGVATVGLAVLAGALGAGYPVTAASVVVALLLVTGGPALLAAVRRRAWRREAGR
jgi:hypothetical protein